MSVITKERIELFIKNPLDNGLTRGEQMEVARIALASLEADVVAWDHEWASCITCDGPQNFERIIEHEAPPEWAIKSGQARNLIPLYTATPSTASVPLAIHDEDFEKALSVLNETLDDCGDSERGLLLALDKAGIEVRSDACRAAILHGDEPSTDNTNQQFESLSRGDK